MRLLFSVLKVSIVAWLSLTHLKGLAQTGSDGQAPVPPASGAVPINPADSTPVPPAPPAPSKGPGTPPPAAAARTNDAAAEKARKIMHDAQMKDASDAKYPAAKAPARKKKKPATQAN